MDHIPHHFVKSHLKAVKRKKLFPSFMLHLDPIFFLLIAVVLNFSICIPASKASYESNNVYRGDFHLGGLRPEMQFSLMDLKVHGQDHIADPDDDEKPPIIIISTEKSPTLLDDIENYNKLFYEIVSDDPDLRPALERFGTDRELIFSLGGNEIRGEIQNGVVQFQFSDINLDLLDPNDLLVLSLYQNGDDSNVLWDYGLDLGIRNIDLEKTPLPINEYDKDLIKPGESAKLIATTKPAGRPVKWEIIRPGDGVIIDYFNSETGEIEVSEETGTGCITVRATDLTFSSIYKDHIVYIGCKCAECKVAGGKELKVHSIDMKFSLGTTDNGRMAGELFVYEATPSAKMASPEGLELSSSALLTGAVKVVRDENNAIKQVLTSQALVEVQTINSYAYKLLFYKNSNVIGGQVLYDGIADQEEPYEINGEPFATYTIENPKGPDNEGLAEDQKNYDHLQISEIRPNMSSPSVNEYEWDPNLNQWSLSLDNGKRVEERIEQADGAGKTVIRIVKDSSGAVASMVRSRFQLFGWGEELVETVVDPDGAQLTTTFDFYQDPTVMGSYGLLKAKTLPDGSWEQYEYDDLRRKTRTISSWLDAVSGSAADQAREIIHDYTPVAPLDIDDDRDKRRPRVITEKINGIVVAKTYYGYQWESSGERTEIVERCANQDSAFGDAGNLRTVTKYLASGKIESRIEADGTTATYSYEKGKYDESSRIFMPGDGVYSRDSIVHGIEGQEQGIANKTIKEVTITNRQGNTRKRESYVYIGSGYAFLDWTAYELDELGRVIETHYSNGSMSEADPDCCGNARTSTDIYGNTSTFYNNGLGQIEKEERQGPNGIITTSYSYDAAGRRKSEIQSAGDLIQTSSRTYDSAGRLDSSTDVAGLVTGYEYPSKVTTIVTRPGGATEQTTTFLDGKVESVTGSGVIPRYYEYGVEADGTRWTKVYIGTLNSPRWEKTYTDILGRTIRTEKPGFNTTEVTENFYNTKGQLIRTTAPGQAAILYEYDELGHQVRSGIDIDNNNVLTTASLDRISENNSVYTMIDFVWWQEISSSVYATDNDSTSTQSGMARTRINQLGDNGLASESVSIDIHGNQTFSRTFIDRSARTGISQIDYPDSDIDATSTMVGGYLVSTTSQTGLIMSYGYDDLGRRTQVTDPRTGTSFTHFNAKGQVEFIKDAAGNTINFAYDPETGRKVNETNSLAKVTRYGYDDFGRIIHTWGVSVYPIHYIYDGYGQLYQMATYRNGENWTADSWPTETGEADTTTWLYDEASGLLTTKIDAGGNSTTYSYMEGGKLFTRTWARTDASAVPLVTTYNYDPNSAELTLIDYSDQTQDVSFIYDRLGRQKNIIDALGTRTFNYNEKFSLESESITGLYSTVLTRTYEDEGVPGRPSGFYLDSGYSISFGFENNGRFKTVSWQAGLKNGTTTYSYLPDSELIHQVLTGSGQLTTYEYEPSRNLKTAVINEHNSTLISKYGYIYDKLGRRTSVANSGLAFTVDAFNIYGYNDRNELIGSNRYQGILEDFSNPIAEEDRSYLYDNIGNRKTATTWDNDQAAPEQLAYTANRLNQYDLIASDLTPEQNLSYDVDGNLTNYDGKTLIYNGENRLVSVEPETIAEGDSKVGFLYDYMGRRVQKVISTWSGGAWLPEGTTYFLYDGWNLIAEFDENGVSEVEYVWGLDLSQSLQGAGGIGGLLAQVDQTADKHHHYFYDANGNVGQLVDANDGALAASYEYDPFGVVIASVGDYAEINAFRFSTKFFDNETGFGYWGYRFYMPELGRWLNKDPIGEEGGINLYGFVGGNPLNWIDYQGLDFGPPYPEHQKIMEDIDKSLKKSRERAEKYCGWMIDFVMVIASEGRVRWNSKGISNLFRKTPKSTPLLETSVITNPRRLLPAPRNPVVTAKAQVNNLEFTDVNQTARMGSNFHQKTLIAEQIATKSAKTGKIYPNTNMSTAHAEVGTIQQAFDAGVTSGAHMRMTVTGKAVCGYCRGHVPAMANQAGLKSLTVFEKETGKTFFWKPGMRSLKVAK